MVGTWVGVSVIVWIQVRVNVSYDGCEGRSEDWGKVEAGEGVSEGERIIGKKVRVRVKLEASSAYTGWVQLF